MGLYPFTLKIYWLPPMETWWREISDSYCYFRPTFRKVLCAVDFCGGQMLIVLLNATLEGSWLRSRQAFRFPTPVWASSTWFNGKLNSWLDVVTIQTSTELNLPCVGKGFEASTFQRCCEKEALGKLRLSWTVGNTSVLDDVHGCSFRMTLLFLL